MCFFFFFYRVYTWILLELRDNKSSFLDRSPSKIAKAFRHIGVGDVDKAIWDKSQSTEGFKGGKYFSMVIKFYVRRKGM